jgi:hypothetical protein
MQKLFNKVAPLGVMTVCTIWCCWAQLREATPLLAATESKLPRIERKLFHPELSPVSERDPFLQYKPEPPPASEKIEAQMEVEEEPPFDPQTVLPSIRLDATILGARPLAVINGKMHNEGERVVLEAAPEVYCRLQRVNSDGIVMTIEEYTFLIGYSNASKEISKPARKTDVVPPLPEGIENALPEGIPNADELESAVADSLANQPQSTDGQDELNSDQTDDLTTHAADEDCEFEQDLLITNKFDELLNNNDE